MTEDQQLRERARDVTPGVMYGHQAVPGAAYPQFMRGGRGARVWDADGHEYVDLMCSYGPVVLGHQHPAVEAAAAEQAKQGDCQNGPGPVRVALAELLVTTVKHADWAMFAKNGTDATTMCATIARAQTGRKTILVATGAYHGAAPWCTPRPAGTTPQDRANLGHYTFNDLASVHQAAAEAGDDLAGIMVSPFKHHAARPHGRPKNENPGETMPRMGPHRRDGIGAQARSGALAVRYTGPPVMPYLTFAGDRDHELAGVFAAQALRGGAYLHPRHNWFVSAAMTGDDLALVLDATDQAVAAVRKHLGQ